MAVHRDIWLTSDIAGREAIDRASSGLYCAGSQTGDDASIQKSV